MPHARRTGTAWDRRRQDYAHTRDLEGTGWAWEFLRRNTTYRKAFRAAAITHSMQTKTQPSLHCYVVKEMDKRAIDWGLLCLADPAKSATETDLFWLPQLVTHHLSIHIDQRHWGGRGGLNFTGFTCRIAVLRLASIDYVVLQQGNNRVQLTIHGAAVFAQGNAFKLEIDGLEGVTRAIPALQALQRMLRQVRILPPDSTWQPSKWQDYLIALDGHLEGRTYRDIAEVLYGRDRVGMHWADNTRWMKSKVRRAVERGVELMNGGYRELL